MRTLWCVSSACATPRIISIARSSLGSSTFTTWKRRVKAGSRSKYFLYSAQVVAAIVRNSPRAKAGFNKLAASPWPSLPPAPIKVWASSINKIIGVGEDCTSSITDFKRFSNSPLTLAPACSKPKSKVRSAMFCNALGTSPCAMRCAKPSTTAVLPTPASPVRMGLFWRRRVRISIHWRISSSRPSTGSILPVLALAVKSMVYLSSVGVLLLEMPPALASPGADWIVPARLLSLVWP